VTNSRTASSDLDIHIKGSNLTLEKSDVVTSDSAGEKGPMHLTASILPGGTDSEQVLQLPAFPGYGVALITLSAPSQISKESN
jgi:hypothetical protein